MKTIPSNIKLNPPPMKCDKSLGKDIPEPLPHDHFGWVISGKPKSGKTSYLLDLITNAKDVKYRNVFHDIYYCIPPSSRSSVSLNLFEKTPPDHIFDTLTVENLNKIKDNCTRESALGYNSLLIIDDQTAYLKQKEILRMLNDLVFRRRHIFLSIFILVQSYKQIPKSIRCVFSHFTIFKPSNKSEIGSIFDELIFLDKKTSEKMLKMVFEKPHDTLFGNTTTGKFYKNFDEIIFEEQ